MAQRWRSFLSLTLLLVSVAFLALSYSLHTHPRQWSDSFWSSWLNIFPAGQAEQLGGAWAGGFFLMGALLLLGSTALLIWGRRWRRGLFLGILLALIGAALLAGAALTDYLSGKPNGAVGIHRPDGARRFARALEKASFYHSFHLNSNEI